MPSIGPSVRVVVRLFRSGPCCSGHAASRLLVSAVGMAARAQALIARESYLRIGVGFDTVAFEVVEGKVVAGHR